VTLQNLQNSIRAILEKEFSPQLVEVSDDSARHQGHAGVSAAGGSHFKIFLVAAYFKGMRPLERHRAVYRVLSGLMAEGIHALQMEILTPDEQHA